MRWSLWLKVVEGQQPAVRMSEAELEIGYDFDWLVARNRLAVHDLRRRIGSNDEPPSPLVK